jgi:hypothetical protein
METAECGFCKVVGSATKLVRGRGCFICGKCVALGLAWAVESRGEGAGREIPEADRHCSFCAKRVPESALYSGGATQAICTRCLGRGYWFLAEEEALRDRQYTWKSIDSHTPKTLIEAHFARVGLERVVTSSRKFPEYMRVDLNKTLVALFPASEVRSIGVHQQYAHETLQYASLLGGEERVSIAPLQYDEIDIGEDLPARCLKSSLWFVADEETPHVVLLTMAKNYGESSGWHVEIAVPEGERGEAVVRRYFSTFEAALLGSASYRGKVLSLEQIGRIDGKGAVVSVHRVAAVRREDVILPARTLELLERNVFRFAEHRQELAALGLPVKKGLLFYGPPGTGKTHTIRYLAGALRGHTTLLVTAEQVGLIDQYMTLARLLSPSILVIEDADLIARQRENMNSPCEEVLLNRLLNEMDGLKENAEILFILTTNRPEALELALTARPGRIDQAIEFPLPDSDGRHKLARLYGKGMQLEDGTLAHVVERSAGVSAAFIKELMRRSVQFALERGRDPKLTAFDVDAALDELLFAGGKLNAALLGASGARAL